MRNFKLPPYITTLILTFLAFIAFYHYGSTHFYRDPGSMFFDENRAYERKYSAVREKEAAAFQNAYYTAVQNEDHPSLNQFTVKANERPQICAVIITVARAGGTLEHHPLELTLTSLLTSLTTQERQDLSLQIYFANTNPTTHPLYTSPLLNLTDGHTSPQSLLNPTDLTRLVDLETANTLSSKVPLDFSLALQHCHTTSSAPYIALFEGDILFANSWFARSLVALRDIKAKTSSSSFHPRISSNKNDDDYSQEEKPQWLDLRLFNAARAIQYSSTHPFGNSVPLIILLTSTPLLLLTYYVRTRTTLGSKHITPPITKSIYIVLFITLPVSIILFFRAGKTSMLPPRPGVKVQNWGCCTQGIIIPREHVLGLAEAMKEGAPTPPDLMFDIYARNEELGRWVADPVMVQHLGLKSHLDPNRPLRDASWSVAFEDLDAETLEREHRRMVEELYGGL